MSRKKRERSERKRSSKSAIAAEVGSPVYESGDLRTARPVRRLAGQVKIHAQGIINRCSTLEAWTRPKGGGAPNPLVVEAHRSLCEVVEGFSRFFATMTALDKLGFSPPRKSYTMETVSGDHVTVIESFRDLYVDLMGADLMVDLVVEKVIPGKGGGFVVRAYNGSKMKVAKCHAVRLS
jgi:hypothetical protein